MKELKTNRSVGVFILLVIVSVICNSLLLKSAFSSIGGLALSAALWGDSGVLLAGIWSWIILMIDLAIGIYIFVLFWGICRDINTICSGYEGEENSKKSPNYLVVMLLSAITFNIYYLYWAYKQGNRLWETAHHHYHKEIKDKGSKYLLLLVLGYFTCGICNYIFMGKLIKNVNDLSAAYNEELYRDTSRRETDAGPENAEAFNGDDDCLTIPMGNWKAGKNPEKGNMECCAGIYEGAVIPVDELELIIGRDESRANIVIKNAKVSRIHCGVRYNPSDGNYIVTDYSTNGTFYKNGEKFQHEIPTSCSPGTILVIAQSGNEFLLK